MDPVVKPRGDIWNSLHTTILTISLKLNCFSMLNSLI
ncbi:MAG: hypothetical protein ACEY3D_04340 [Rickettsia sp.]